MEKDEHRISAATRLFESAEELLKEGRVEEAVGKYRGAVNLNQRNAEYWFGLATAMSERNYGDDLRQATKCLKKAIAIDKNKCAYWCLLSDTYYRTDNYRQGLRCAKRACKVDSQSWMAWCRLSTGLAYFGNLSESRVAIQQALQCSPPPDDMTKAWIHQQLTFLDQELKDILAGGELRNAAWWVRLHAWLDYCFRFIHYPYGLAQWPKGFPGKGSFWLWRATNAMHNEGNYSIKEADYDGAIEKIKEYIARYPHDAQYWTNLSFCYSRRRQEGDVVQCLRCDLMATSLNPHLADVWCSLTESYVDNGQQEAAERAARRAIAINPCYFRCWWTLALSFKAQGKPVEQKAAILKALSCPEPPLPQCKKIIEKQLGSLDNVGSIDGVELYPDMNGILEGCKQLLGIAFKSLFGIGYKPCTAFESGKTSQTDDDSLTLPERANTLRLARKFESALKAYTLIANANPKDPENWNDFAVCYMEREQNGDWETANKLLRRALKIRPDSAPAWNNLSALYFRRDKIKDSLAFAKRAIEIDANEYLAWLNLGHALHALGKFREKKEAYVRALSCDPPPPDEKEAEIEQWIHYTEVAESQTPQKNGKCQCGLAQRVIGFLTGRICSQRALEFPGKGTRYLWIKANRIYDAGAVFRDKCDYDSAIQEVLAAVKLYPYDAQYWKTLGFCYLKRLKPGDCEQSVRCLKRAISLCCCDSGSWTNMAAAYCLAGRYRDSERCARMAIMLLDTERCFQPWCSLGQSYEYRGLEAEALASYKQALNLWDPVEDPDSIREFFVQSIERLEHGV